MVEPGVIAVSSFAARVSPGAPGKGAGAVAGAAITAGGGWLVLKGAGEGVKIVRGAGVGITTAPGETLFVAGLGAAAGTGADGAPERAFCKACWSCASWLGSRVLSAGNGANVLGPPGVAGVRAHKASDISPIVRRIFFTVI